MKLKGSGTNNLIKKGAMLVTSPKDILDKFNIDYNKDIINDNIFIKVKPEYEILFDLIKTNPITIEELCKKSKMEITNINSKLTMMEIEGLIKSLPRK